ncbi:MAG: U32 family peptidase [Acutalibacteraceae bacterium]
MKEFEILAPAGAKEQLLAAVRCGANAVYLGCESFNARRNAENFTDDGLKAAVKYCHLRAVKVYVTLNTIIFDDEISELYETVKTIAKCGADAVIVQDFATVKAVKDICPDLPLHASTQMAVHNVSGAKFLEDLGFRRIVLARELSLYEMKVIRENVNAELEVFVHGAHCMSASGNCYLSAMLGERSGNRGLCAQGCRLNWKNQHGREYALSLKDMSYLDSIKDLMAIGIDSFKIEGRMKRPEYVASAVTSLKKAMNGENYNKEILKSVFSRSGFTDGYLKGSRTPDMFGYRKKEDVVSANDVLKNLESLYKDETSPNGVNAVLTLEKDAPSRLSFSFKGVTAEAFGEMPQEPRTAPLSFEIAYRNISKLGGTSLYLENLEFNNKDNLTLPASLINALRRDCAEKLENKLSEKEYAVNDVLPEEKKKRIFNAECETHIRLHSFSQYSESLSKADYIILPVKEIISHIEEVKNIKEKLVAELPELIYPSDENSVSEELKLLCKTGIKYGFTGNISGITLLKNAGMGIFASHGLNITNTLSERFFESSGVEKINLSFELTVNGLKNIGSSKAVGAYAYGYLPLMLMRSCPQKGYGGCDNCNGKTYLEDRKGIKFPVICNGKKFSVLYNSVPLYVGDKNLNMLDFATLYFTVESKEECERIYNAFLCRVNIEGKKTKGLFYRELI